ncbi:MAG: hypothetical protein E6X17_08975 [Sporomusaceae bacterium]|nr:hypothetical protein [Sporomusaceae bacterium]
MNLQQLTRTGLLLALMLLFQSLRLLLPLPPFASVFVIGSLVNACLLLAVEFCGWRPALLPALIAPLAAYLQQMLPLPVFILPVAAANAAYVLGYAALAGRCRPLAVAVATAAKFIIVYFVVAWLTGYVDLPQAVASRLAMLLGWPQLITGIAGGGLCYVVRKRNVSR